MANKRHKPEEIVTKLRQVDVLVGQGSSNGVPAASFVIGGGPFWVRVAASRPRG